MNKANLKSYAPQARQDFIAAVTARANLLGLSEKSGQLEVAPAQTQGDVTLIAGQAWPAKVATQRDQLITRMRREGFAHTCEAVAYTWFNRFAALRYMELHDYLGHGHRALSSAEGTLPDILTHAADLANAASSGGDYGLPGLKPALVTEMKLAGNRDGELYRMLLVAQCNALSVSMPFLFERIDDDTELLLPDNLLRTDSVIAKLVQAIPEENWAEVEIIGWLYQFYISEKKDQVIGKVVKSEDIPAATQLFTPNWIVQYLVQNSVGRLWLMANPASTLASQWPYYIQPAEQTPEVQAQLGALIQTRMDEDGGSLNPESITVLDPACGSGHILVVAYDVLKAIYLERGYQARVIPRLILEKNLYGLDIDDRAAQMAGFALLMKARADDRRLFNEPPKLNVLSLQESKRLDAEALAQVLLPPCLGEGRGGGIPDSSFAANDLFPATRPQMMLGESDSHPRALSARMAEGSPLQAIHRLIDTFAHAKTFGSLIQISPALTAELPSLLKAIKQALQTGDLYAQAAAQDLLPLVQQALVLGMQFDAVVANPPYMGGKGMNVDLKDYAKNTFPNSKADMFSMFMDRCQSFGKSSAELGFVTPYVWMFISSYEAIRRELIEHSTIESLIQLEYNAFEPACVPVCSFVIGKMHIEKYTGSYISLADFKGHESQSPKTLEAINNRNCGWLYEAKPDDFKNIPGYSIAYSMEPSARRAFADFPPLESSGVAASGLQTSNNEKYLRYWHEISKLKLALNLGKCDLLEIKNFLWIPHNKGGKFRRWYGNNEWVLKWNLDELQADPKVQLKNMDIQTLPAVTWSHTSSSSFSVRYSPEGFSFNVEGPIFIDKDDIYRGMAYLASNVALYFMGILNPTLHFLVGNVKQLPYIATDFSLDHVKECIKISKDDWDSFETSWDFESHPFVLLQSEFKFIKNSFEKWNELTDKRVLSLGKLEEYNNNYFISAFCLQDELTPEVPKSQITLARADREKDCQRLISYAIGCMMGRYSLDEPGLIYAHAGNVGFDASRYASFPADADGIVPLTDELWFTDDAASRVREFLLAVWGADTLEENMAWLAESLGTKASETPDETIRRYLADKFFKDHLQTYKKRPIYWLFSSGKQGAFQALVYLHRYTEGTLARLRAEYVVPLTSKMQSRIDMLQKDALAASSTAARNKLNKDLEKLKKKHAELLAYDEQLRHYADMRITLDLDDGVKVNYGKFGDLLEGVKVVTGGAGDE
jgi:type II restriction/modification system DNA methylase subunit YeeA